MAREVGGMSEENATTSQSGESIRKLEVSKRVNHSNRPGCGTKSAIGFGYRARELMFENS